MNDFDMYTDRGNQRVAAIVRQAKAQQLPWAEVYNRLLKLSKESGFEEAGDTEVREAVYEAVGYDQGECHAN